MIFSDAPITEPDQDILNRNRFVEQMAHYLVSRDSKESVVIALYGKWGTGKTSILNMILSSVKAVEQPMAEDQRSIVIEFNPWYFSEQDQLLRAFFERIGVKTNRENAQ